MSDNTNHILQKDDYWDYILAFVDKFECGLYYMSSRHKIYGLTDMGDYFQTAYLVAFEVLDKHEGDVILFQKTFWYHLKSRFCGIYNVDFKGMTPLLSIIDILFYDYEPTPKDKDIELMEAILQQCLRLMEINPRLIWEYLLGFRGNQGACSIRDVAIKFHMAPKSIRYFMQKGVDLMLKELSMVNPPISIIGDCLVSKNTSALEARVNCVLEKRIKDKTKVLAWRI